MNADKINLWLKRIIYGLTGLALLTPLLIDKGYLFPFISSKLFIFRILVELALFVYIILALRDPATRPGKSKILYLAAAYLGAVLLAGLLGVNLYKSFWGTIERGDGLVGGGTGRVVLEPGINDQLLARRRGEQKRGVAEIFVGDRLVRWHGSSEEIGVRSQKSEEVQVPRRSAPRDEKPFGSYSDFLLLSPDF